MVKRLEETGAKYFHDRKAFIEYSNDMNDYYTNFNDCDPKQMHNIDYIWWYDFI